MGEQQIADLSPTSIGITSSAWRKFWAVLWRALMVSSFAVTSVALPLLVILFLDPFRQFPVAGFSRRLRLLLFHPVYMLDRMFLGVCLALFVLFLATWLSIPLLRVLAYLRSARSQQKRYFELYTPLKAWKDAYQTPIMHIPHEDDLTDQWQEMNLLELARQHEGHLLLLGLPGAGKTMFLHYYQYVLLQQLGPIMRKRKKIPVLIQLNAYNLYLQRPDVRPNAKNLLDFLCDSKGKQNMRFLHRYVKKMERQGRLLFLCDGLNEVDGNLLEDVCGELRDLMGYSDNSVVVTCRELDYKEQEKVRMLGRVENTERFLIHPLGPKDIQLFVHGYVDKQKDTWTHSAEDILLRIEQSSLQQICTNPFMLFAFMYIIDKVGFDGQHMLDTRGLLIQEYLSQMIDQKLGNAAFTREDVLDFLSELACAARWAEDRTAIRLAIGANRGQGESGIPEEELAEDIKQWLEDHPARGAVVAEQETEPFHTMERAPQLPELLRFAKKTELIVVSANGVLSFRHELIAEYLVARYFWLEDGASLKLLPLRADLFDNARGRNPLSLWSEPISLWAGLIANPLILAGRIAEVGLNNPRSLRQAAGLSLRCISVKWHPPQGNIREDLSLPGNVKEILRRVIVNSEARTILAGIINRCTDEAGLEVYYAFLPLLSFPGIVPLITQLHQRIVPILCTHLTSIVDNPFYSEDVEHLKKIIGRFGQRDRTGYQEVIDWAIELSHEAPQRSLATRCAAINILGYTENPLAITSLLTNLRDSRPEIIEASWHSLTLFTPDTVLERLFEVLRVPALPFPVHGAIMQILWSFFTSSENGRQLKPVQEQEIVDAVVMAFSSPYSPHTQHIAVSLLVKLATTEIPGSPIKKPLVINKLIQQLASPDQAVGNNAVKALGEIGESVIPSLVSRLRQLATDLVRERIVAVFSLVPDARALSSLLSLVGDQSPNVQRRVQDSLHHYAQFAGCIAGLIDLVLRSPHEFVANHAAIILESFDKVALMDVTQALPTIVPGRTRKLVSILGTLQDERALPGLIDLFRMPQTHQDNDLGLELIRTLGKFPDKRVAVPLLSILRGTNDQLIDEAIDALSGLGMVVFADTIAALQVEQETTATRHVRKVLLDMKTFPGEELFHVFTTCDDALRRHIEIIFHDKGSEAAHVLVGHLPYADRIVQSRVLRILYAMDRNAVIPAFLAILKQPSSELLAIATDYLKQYREAILPLVRFLRMDDMFDSATHILLTIGPAILPALVEGLDEPESRERAQFLVKTLWLEDRAIFPAILDMFASIGAKSTSQSARDVLLDVLTGDLANQITPYLLAALTRTDVARDVCEALIRLARRHETKNEVLGGLLEALRCPEKREVAIITLVKLGEMAVDPVSDLIMDADAAEAAQRILVEIGEPALRVVWSLCADTSEPARRDIGKSILIRMPTPVIQEKVVELLTNGKVEDVEMALTLLLERIQNEPHISSGNQAMIPALLNYIQTNGAEQTKLRILALLMLLDSSSVAHHLLQTLQNYPNHDERLVQLFLFLRHETAAETLHDAVNPQNTRLLPRLRAQLIGVLGMIKRSEIDEYSSRYARTVGARNVSVSGRQPGDEDEMAIALRALGGLLASGQWDVKKLQEQRHIYEFGRRERELFDILLGDLYYPRIKEQEGLLQKEIIAHARDAQQLREAKSNNQNLRDTLEQRNTDLAQAGLEMAKKDTEIANLKQRLSQRPVIFVRPGTGTGSTGSR